MITKDMIANGLSSGVVMITDRAEDYGCIGTCCRIGDNAFYFAGSEGEDMTAEEYLKNVPREDIVNEIYDALNDGDFKEIFEDEYKYYELVLREVA